MKNTCAPVLLFFALIALAQEPKNNIDEDVYLQEIADKACGCIDAIEVLDKTRADVALEINACIDKHVLQYQAAAKVSDLFEVASPLQKETTKDVKINVTTDKNSEEYKKYYYEMERYLLESCTSLQSKIATDDELRDKSISRNEKAYAYFVQGVEASQKGELKEAANWYEKAVKEDFEFAFAWDNLGLTYRKLNELDKAIAAYENSIKVDPNAPTPLQNLAVAYQYKKDYPKAIEAYERLAVLEPENPEVSYGLGNLYTFSIKDLEKGLDYTCKAYNSYIEQKSPYRADAEKIINYIYQEMKQQKKLDTFNAILAKHNIKPE